MASQGHKEAEINKLIRLPERPAGPIERWQMLPVVRTTTAPQQKSSGLPRPSFPTTPLTQRSTNVMSRSPEGQSRVAIKYKTPKTPGTTKPPATTNKTPGQACKTPKSASKKTPGKNAYTPSSCRYIPSR